jgi:signal transduction histidine kinase
MRPFLRGKAGGLVAFLAIAGLVAGGLGWVTAAALRLERQQQNARVEKERADKLHLALWRLDGRVAPVLAREESRPYSHYVAVSVPSVILRPDGQAWPHGAVLAPSPLLHADVPDWMLLHFQADAEAGWESPQVLHGALRRRLANPLSRVPLTNVTDGRRRLLEELERDFRPDVVVAAARERGAVADLRDTTSLPTSAPWEPFLPNNNNDSAQGGQGQAAGKSEYHNRFEQQSRVQRDVNPPASKEMPDVALNNIWRNGAGWFSAEQGEPIRGEQTDVRLSPLVPLWMGEAGGKPRLMLARLVKVCDTEVCQGILLDWERLQQVLAHEIADLFPGARLEPVLPGTAADPERTMSTLRVQLVSDAEPEPQPDPAWTPLRVGLALAWTASLVALVAVGLGGWSLLDLSERRIRFVSAVTHELRTPLTTLRLYLDMLTGGMVTDEAQKGEYLQTLNGEAERLNRLVGNVLDFSRLENQSPRLQKTPVTLATLLEGVKATWDGRCHDAGKELVVETVAPAEALVETDVGVVQQVVGNLIDNACKYSRGAADCRVWVRARGEGGRLVLEVEDRGPGVPAAERRSIFRPFRRGKGSDTVGGVGLGLALARRWASLLGGRLTLGAGAGGACFRLELPLLEPVAG